jgi:precorrin-2 dehydrogenase/sirohydrochlorin ferrochelatase
MSLFPMFVKLAGRDCLVVGAGRVAQTKIASLLAAGASVRVVAPQATRQVMEWARANTVRWLTRPFEPADLDGAFLAIAATSSSDLNELVFRECQRRGVLCNVVDDPPRCDFYYPAVVRRGELQIAVSTGGHSPALAQRLRRELEEQFGAEYGSWLESIGNARRMLLASRLDPRRRRRLLKQLASRESFEAITRPVLAARRIKRRRR